MLLSERASTTITEVARRCYPPFPIITTLAIRVTARDEHLQRFNVYLCPTRAQLYGLVFLHYGYFFFVLLVLLQIPIRLVLEYMWMTCTCENTPKV